MMKILRRRRTNRLAESAAASIYNSRLEVRLAVSAVESAIEALDRALIAIEAEEEAGAELVEAGLGLVEIRARIPAVHRAADRAVALVLESDKATAELAIACVAAGIDLARYDEVVAASAGLASERDALASEVTKFATGVTGLLRRLDSADALGEMELTDEFTDEFEGEFTRLASQLSPQASMPLSD